MSNLLIHQEAFKDRIEDFGFEYLSFAARKLAQGQRHSEETGAHELAIVVLAASAP
jgi:5-deoxy-D-glucuronate isomerase